MNTSALTTRLLHLAARPFVLLLGFLKKVALAVFGRVQWSPPRWASQSRAAISGFNRAHPLITASGIIAILLLSCGAAWTWHWYQHRPKPRYVSVKIEPIPVTKLEKDLTFPTLDLRFSDSAARLEDLKKTSLPGVRLDPPLAGKWMWANDQHLFFKPAEDWPADQKFKIIFDKKFLPPHVLVERLSYEFTTPAFEIAEYFDWTVPDHLIVPGGNLANSSALGKGFRELKELGLVARVPRISVIQAVGANPLVRSIAANHGESMEPVEAHTRASAIRIGNPASWRKAARVVQETGGFCLDVSEAEIAIAKAELGEEGLGCEPASAVTLAGLKKLRAQKAVGGGESVVLVLTGHTLKDADYTIDFHRGTLLRAEEARGYEAPIEGLRRDAISVEATPEAVLAAVKGIA